MRIENEVLSKFIYQPEEINTHELDPRWFFDKTNKQIAQTLIKNEGRAFDATGLHSMILKDHPYFRLSADELEGMRIDGITPGDLEEKVKQLKYRYHKEQLERASARFYEYPSEKHLKEMEDCLRELKEIEIPEDDGSLDETVEQFHHELEESIKPGILTYPQIDETLGGGMYGGMLITIGARPGVGKSAYGVNLACQAMVKQKDIVIDFFTLEMSKSRMLKRFLSELTEINSYRLRNPNLSLKEEEKHLLTAKSLEILDTHLRIHDSLFGLKEIERQIRRRHYEAKGKPYIAFIDYLGLIDTDDKRQPRHVQIGEITRRMKIMTNELDIPIILFSQLNRGIEARADKRPNLADLRESGSVEQDSNVVMFLYNDEETDETIVEVAKNREGYTGQIKYRFLKSKIYFQEVAT